MQEAEIQSLLQKIEKLIDVHEDLRDQLKTMRNAEASWQAERAKLTQHNEVARRKVSEMISRLQILERNSG